MSTTLHDPTLGVPKTPEETPAEGKHDPPGPEDALFDKRRYDDPELALPKVDGEGTDKIALKISGTVTLDRTDPRDVALMRAMKGGGDVTLMIEGRCSKKSWAFDDDRDGGVKEVRLEHAVAVHTVYKPNVE